MYHLLIFFFIEQDLKERDVSPKFQGVERASRLYSLFNNNLFIFTSLFNNNIIQRITKDDFNVVYACLQEKHSELIAQLKQIKNHKLSLFYHILSPNKRL